MTNDITYLRFYRGQEASPSLSTSDLETVSIAMLQLLREVAVALGSGEISDARLNLIAPPRTGCLELLTQPSFTTTLDLEVLAVTMGSTLDAFLKGIADNADVLSLLWLLTFGERCVLDLWSKKEKHAEPKAGSEFLLKLSERALGNQRVVAAASSLMETARLTGMDKITVQVRDDAPVIVYADGNRRRRGIMGYRRQGQTFPSRDTGDRYGLSVQPSGDAAIPVSFEGLPCTAIPAIVDEHVLILLVWTLGRRINAVGQTEVRGKWIPFEAIEPLDDVPELFELAAGAFLVTGVVTVES